MNRDDIDEFDRLRLYPPAEDDRASLRRELENYAVWTTMLLICFAVWCLIVWGVWAAIR